MCGRYVLKTSTPQLAAILGAEPIIDDPISGPAIGWQPRFNIAPTMQVPTIKLNDNGIRVLQAKRWGLVPHWAKDLKLGASMINARCETVSSKPAFRSAFKQRRCLIPADGYYEWQRLDGRKQPHFIYPEDQRPLVFAGLWERWRGADDAVIETCTILTARANEDVVRVHDRMPVLLNSSESELWLQGSVSDVQTLLRPPPSGRLGSVAVSTFVNNARNDGERCITPLSAD